MTEPDYRCLQCGRSFLDPDDYIEHLRAHEAASNCMLCNEELGPRDEAMHRACSLRSAVGGIGHLLAHNYWCIERGDPDAGMTFRQSAIMVEQLVAVVGVDKAIAMGSS